VPELSRENWRVWFKQFEYWMIGERIDFVANYTLFQYAALDTPALTSSTSTPSTNINVDGITKGFAKLGIETQKDTETRNLDEKRHQDYRAANGKVLFMLSKCLGEFDQQFVEPYTNAKDQWDALRAKYSKTNSIARREDLQQITGFKFGTMAGQQIEMTIQSAWAYLVSVRGKIALADPKLATTFDEDTLFEYLLAGLPESFNVIQQSFEGNTNVGVYEKLEILDNSERC
jgi:hypothetical protein